MIRKELNVEVFDDWFAAGHEADEWWQKYEIDKGKNYKEALNGYAADHVYSYDKYHLDRADVGVLVLPAGKSGHLELGYLVGKGKQCYILLPEKVERWDVMYKFATKVCFTEDELLNELRNAIRSNK